MSDNKLEDSNSDKKYFMVTPQLVWAICRSPYDFTLWNVIKMIAGENGECFLSTEDLATLAMMSAGKVSECRKFLIGAGLLDGELRRDPGYPQPVWHLKIPDLWKQNIEWRQDFDLMADRIALKREQKKSLHQVKPSPGEEGITPGEEGITPGEEGITPGETKKNHKEEPSKNQKGKPEGGDASRSPPPADSRSLTDLPDPKAQMAILFPSCGSGSVRDFMQSIQVAGWNIRNADIRRAAALFLKYSGLPIPNDKSTRNGWLKVLTQHVTDFGVSTLETLYPETIAYLRERDIMIGWPGSVTKTLPAICAKLNDGGSHGLQCRQSPAHQDQRTGPDAQQITAALEARARPDRGPL